MSPCGGSGALPAGPRRRPWPGPSPQHLRRETRRLGYEPFEDLPGETYVLLEDIQGISYEFYDNVKDEWVEEWDTTSLDGQPNRLPPRVRIYLSVLDERGRPLTLVTEARITLTDALNLSPPAVRGIYGVGGRRPGRRGTRGYGGVRGVGGFGSRRMGLPQTTRLK